MLTSLFEWLDRHPESYGFIVATATAVVAAWCVAAIRREAGDTTPRRTSPWPDALLIGLFLLAWRWPFLLSAEEYNPDESHLIAGAIALTHDPVFWRSVDGVTSGPLDFYALVPLRWLGLPLDYFTGRLVGLLGIALTLAALHAALAGKFGRAAAWLGVLPGLLFFATVTDNDFIHLSNEYLTLPLVGFAVFLLAPTPGTHRRRWIACCLAGAAPWAKLHASPLSVALIVWALIQEWTHGTDGQTPRRRRIAQLLVGAAAPTIVLTAVVSVTGQAAAAWERYFLHAIAYAGKAQPLSAVVRELAARAANDGRLPLFGSTVLLLILAATIGWIVQRRRPAPLFLPAVLLALVAVLTVLAPRREFLHYTLLLIGPFTLMAGAAVGSWWRDLSRAPRVTLATVVLLGVGLPFLVTRWQQSVPGMFGQFSSHWRRPRSCVALLVDALAAPRETVAVWGWAARYYVEARRAPGVRDTVPVDEIVAGPETARRRAEYLEDFRRNRPVVFIDAVGPEAFAFQDRATQAHEIFPELAEEVRRGYALVGDLGEARVFARNDLAARREMTPARLDAITSLGRMKAGLRDIAPTRTPAFRLRREIRNQRNVVMLPAGAQIEWLLTGRERLVTFEFGVDPTTPTTPTELVLELVDGAEVRPLWERRLDPGRQSTDLGLQFGVANLTPQPAGVRLVLRSQPGRGAIAYLATLQFPDSVRPP